MNIKICQQSLIVRARVVAPLACATPLWFDRMLQVRNDQTALPVQWKDYPRASLEYMRIVGKLAHLGIWVVVTVVQSNGIVRTNELVSRPAGADYFPEPLG